VIWAILSAAAFIVAASGLALKYFIHRLRKDSQWNISWREFAVGIIAAYLVVLPAVFTVGVAMSTADALRYEEFYNGVETSAPVQVVECRPGTAGDSESSGHSNCRNEYQTGETYNYLETYYVSVCSSNSKGETSCTSEPRVRVATGYIHNPYAQKEYSYAITDSLGGTFNFPGVYLKDTEAFTDTAIPAEIPRGDPAEWTDAKQRLEARDPRPVTRLFSYDNYILASGDDLLKAYSDDVEQYLEEGILPEHTAGILTDPLHGFNDSSADKVSFVGIQPSNSDQWQESVMRFNAALGSELRGDLHLVLIDSSLVDSPTNYMNALKAYWTSDAFNRRAIAKNAIIVVAGVDGNSIDWGIASTGMPYGNEVMLRGIQNFLPGTDLDPNQVIGAPRTVVTTGTETQDDEVTVTLSDTPGVLERVVLQDFPFARACMDCKEEDGEIGYADLVVKVQPKPWQWSIMLGIVTLLSLTYWTLASRYELFNWARFPKHPKEDPYDRYISDVEEQKAKRLRLRRRSGDFK
jgi:hypothetical protein